MLKLFVLLFVFFKSIAVLLSLLAVLLIVRATHRTLGASARGIGSAWRALGRVIERLLLALSAATVGGILVAVVVAEWPEYDPLASGLLAGALLLPAGLVGAIRFTRRGGNASQSAVSRTLVVDSAGGSAATPKPANRSTTDEPMSPAGGGDGRGWFGIRGKAAPEEAAQEALDAAWSEIAVRADWAMSRIAVARASCTRLLRQADAASLNLEANEWAVVIRRRVPGLVRLYLDQHQDTAARDREGLLEDVVETLEQIAAEADRRSRRAHGAGREAFDLLRMHIANRAGRNGEL